MTAKIKKLPKGLKPGDWLMSPVSAKYSWRSREKFALFLCYASVSCAWGVHMGDSTETNRRVGVSEIYGYDDWKKCERPAFIK